MDRGEGRGSLIDDLNGFERFIGTFGFPIFLLLLALIVLWDRNRRLSEKRRSDDDRPERTLAATPAPASDPAPVSRCGSVAEPYRVFTREFDLELDAERVPAALLRASPDLTKGWTDLRGGWQRVVARAKSLPSPDTHVIAALLSARLGSLPCPPEELAVTLLVDQSGSMRGEPIIATVVAIEAIADALSRYGLRTEVLGFSTAGWHGGYARQRWLQQGAPVPLRAAAYRLQGRGQADMERRIPARDASS